MDGVDLKAHMDPYGRMILVVETCGTLPKEHRWKFKSNQSLDVSFDTR